MNYSKYKLALCVPFDPSLHGMNNNSDKNICSHYLVYEIIDPRVFIENYPYTLEILIDVRHYYDAIITEPHPIIRNYGKIIQSEEYFKFDIIQNDILRGDECVGYIKTFWLKLIQRKWKRFFKERQDIIKKMSNPKHLMMREIRGKI